MMEDLWGRFASWSAAAGVTARRRIRDRSPRTERLLMVLAVLLFAAAAAFGVQRFPREPGDLRWIPLLAGALGGVFPTAALNALEYVMMGRIVGRRVRWSPALRVTVLASAANALPVPGAVLVRVQGLADLDVPYARAVGSAGIIGVAWVATTVLAAGVLQIAYGSLPIGVGAAVAGLLGLMVAYGWLFRRNGSEAPALGLRILGIEAAFVGVSAGRMLLLLWGLGSSAGWAEAMALTVAAALASAVGFLPGGLGLREVLAAGIGPLVGLPVSMGVLAAVAQRLGSFAVLGVVALLFALRGSGARTGTTGRLQSQTGPDE